VIANRRDFLHALGGAGAALALGAGGVRLVRAQAALSVTPLRDGLALICGAGGNVVLATGGDGLVAVDSGIAARAQSLKNLVTERFGGAPLAVLLNTHWHVEHTGGNETLAASGTQIVAHESTRLWMSTKIYDERENRYYMPRVSAALPNATFFTHEHQPLEVGSGAAKALYAQLPEAHTDGDIYVFFPEHNVLVAGGAATAGRYPHLDYRTGGWIGGLADATRKLVDLADADTLIVPDEGPPQRRADLEAQAQMLSAVRERIEAIALQGRGVEDMIAERITADFDERYAGDAARFIEDAYEGLWWNRLRGIVA
jgi:glyoxylase-like metal-dependent hydrolase (beta-lactamase superfamily II)